MTVDYSEYDPNPVLDPSVGFESYNNVERAIDLLLEQFKDKPNIAALLETYSGAVQDVENLITDVFINSELPTAVGAQLDILGRLFGEDRQGKSDSEYRAAIEGRISIRASQGTPDQILAITKALTHSTSVNIHEHYPAEYAVSAIVSDPLSGEEDSLLEVPPSIADNIKLATSAGVGPVTVELYLDTNALLGELSVVQDGVQVIDAGGVLFDLVNEAGDFIQYQSIDPAGDLGGFGVLAEIAFPISPTTGILAEVIISGD